ncbi:hypothetical protein HDU86_005592 [Geranomyces michiganensis]|nr:hypothetical protein HDU86_005592 [Geranomyces michiganensis]
MCQHSDAGRRVDDMSSLNTWEDASQGGGGPANYSIQNGGITFTVGADTAERPKLAYKGMFFRTPKQHHQFRVYIPTRVEGDIASTAVFLYSTDYQEFDFEIGYGGADIRKELTAQPDDLIAFMTTQARDGVSWNSSDQARVLIKGDRWYDLAFDLDVDGSGHFLVKWYIDGVLTFQSQQRWGPRDMQNGFRALISLENLGWMGGGGGGAGAGVEGKRWPGPNRVNTASFASYRFTSRGG